MSKQGFYHYPAVIPAEQKGWVVMVHEHEILTSGTTTPLRSFPAYSCALLSDAQDVADELHEAYATAAKAHQGAYIHDRVSTYAIDYRRPDGPDGPARRSYRRTAITVVMAK